MMIRTSSRWTLAAIAAVMSLSACEMKPAEEEGRRVRKVSKANIATFDPSELKFDIMSAGTERPDEEMIQQAFESAFPQFDACVSDEKDRTGSDSRIPGEIALSVRLNPKESRPIGVNADGPKSLMKREKLINCFREAVAAAPFPTYDGVPVQSDISIEVEP